MEKIIETCTSNDKPATGWFTGPTQGEFFQIGFRPLNNKGSKHTPFGKDAGLQQSCPASIACDQCMGGGNGNVCSQGENTGCACTTVAFTQPAPPKVTNCATAVVAAMIQCCNGGTAGYKACAQKIEATGVSVNLESSCQAAVTTQITYQTCGQFNPDDKIVKGSKMDEIATGLNTAFSLKAEFQYA